MLILQREDQVRVEGLHRARMDATTALRIPQGFPSQLSKTAFSILISDSVALQEKSNYKLPACPHLKINCTCTRCLVFFPSFFFLPPAAKCVVSNNTPAMLWWDRMSVPPEVTEVKGYSLPQKIGPLDPLGVDLISALGLKDEYLELERRQIPKANRY